MPLPDCEVACRLLSAIVAGRWPWSCSVGLALSEAEISGPAEACRALAWLEVNAWIARWSVPPLPSDDEGKGGKAEALAVTLTPWALEMMATVMLGERYELELIENATGERLFYGWQGQMPPSYRLPVGDRLPSLHDPRMAAVVASLTTTEGDHDDFEYLADHRGEMTTLFGRPIAIASSWGAASRADEAARAKRGAKRKECA